MATKWQEVPCIFPLTDREVSLKAISTALLRIHANYEGLTWKQIAKALDCSVETVAAARDEENLLSFDAVARIGQCFPEEYARYIAPVTRRDAPTTLTVTDRLAIIRQHMDAIEREAAA